MATTRKSTKDTLKTPDVVGKVTEKANKRADEVKEIQIETHHDNVTNVPTEPVSTAFGAKPKSDKPVAITFAQIGQEVLVYLDEREVARYEREEWLGFIRHVNQIGSSL